MAEKPPDDRDPRPADAGDTAPLSSPYGPQPKGVDEAAGGADSSPHETQPSDPDKGKNPPDDRSPCQAPPGWYSG